MRNFLLLFPLFLFALAAAARAFEAEITETQAFAIARAMVDNGELQDARLVLENITLSEDAELETERKFLLGQIALTESDYDAAIGYFRDILAVDPTLARVRLDLASAYMRRGSYMKADYHLRLAAAGDLPPAVQVNVMRMMYEIRANKDWSLWLSFGLSPDSNINNATEGEQCIEMWGFMLCNQLPDKERDLGRNLAFGGSFEFKLDERWRIKNDFGFSGTKYANPAYDDIYIYASSGPRYVYSRGDAWLALALARRWVAHAPYNYQVGAKADFTYEMTKRLSASFELKYMPTRYDEYGAMDGDTRGASLAFNYALASSQYMVFKAGLEREKTDDELYANTRRNIALGYGAELPWGFSIYIEPSVIATAYDSERMYVKDGWFEPIRRRDVMRKYSLQLLNRKIDIYGFTPQLGYSYVDRASNVWQSEFSKNTFEINFTQRF